MSESAARPELAEIDLSSLARALGQLESAIQSWAEKPSDTLIRDAVIQRFEFTYELSIRILRRHLRSVAASEDEIEALSFKELIRHAGEKRLLQGGVLEWLDFRQARNDTVHTYNEARAEEVAAAAKGFAEEARVLFDNLSRRLQQ
ncbi:MAG TPA: HI0074 family nucleotidyltransferase substrate-binding subunit [Acidobacteriaceae bacterium]